MGNDLQQIISQLKQSTGIGIGVYFMGGEEICSTHDFKLPNFKDFSSINAVVSDKENHLTFFPLKTQHIKCFGVVKGSDETCRNYAEMLSVLISQYFLQTKSTLSKTEKLKLFLRNELDERTEESLREEYTAKPFHYYVLTMVTDSTYKLHELINFLDAVSDKEDFVIPYEEKAVAYIKKCGDADEYQSANDFAFTLYDNIKEELRINIIINVGGTAHAFNELIVFFNQCAFAYNFGKVFTPSAHIYSYKEYIMIKMLADIPKQTLMQYMDTLLDKNSLAIFSDDELMSTAEEFLKNSLNISETSRSMYMHRNTLIYRLDKIENATGLNLRHFNDAVIFRILTILNKLITTKI